MEFEDSINITFGIFDIWQFLDPHPKVEVLFEIS